MDRAVRITEKHYTPQRERLCMLWGIPVILTVTYLGYFKCALKHALKQTCLFLILECVLKQANTYAQKQACSKTDIYSNRNMSCLVKCLGVLHPLKVDFDNTLLQKLIGPIVWRVRERKAKKWKGALRFHEATDLKCILNFDDFPNIHASFEKLGGIW